MPHLAGSAALRRFLRPHPARASRALARVEVLRSVRAHGDASVARVRQVLARIVLVAIDDEILEAAAELGGNVLRSVDAIHVATALRLGSDLEVLVTYDERMASAAVAAVPGVRLAAP